MAIEAGLDLIREVFTNTMFNGSYIIVQIFVLLASLVLISREPKHWRTLALPLAMGWHLVGFYMSYVLIVLTAILFVVDTMSTSVLSGAIGAIGNAFNAVRKHEGYLTEKRRLKRRVDRVKRGEKVRKYKDYIKDEEIRKIQKDIEREENYRRVRKNKKLEEDRKFNKVAFSDDVKKHATDDIAMRVAMRGLNRSREGDTWLRKSKNIKMVGPAKTLGGGYAKLLEKERIKAVQDNTKKTMKFKADNMAQTFMTAKQYKDWWRRRKKKKNE